MGSDPTLVRIGYQKYGTLNIVRAQGDLEKALTQKGKKVHWFLFTAGPQLLEALNAGVIDVGNTGEAPDLRPGGQPFSGLPWQSTALSRGRGPPGSKVFLYHFGRRPERQEGGLEQRI